MRVIAGLIGVLLTLASLRVAGQEVTYRLVPDWAKLPAGWVLGQATPPPGPDERTAQAAARAAAGGPPPGASGSPGGMSSNRMGVSGVAVDARDRVYAYNRGPHPIVVFGADGKYLMSGAEAVPGGINTPHMIEVDAEGHVWIIDEDNHRVLKLAPALDKVLLELGTMGEKGDDATHFNRPTDIAFTKSGDVLVSDGYGNNRVAKFAKDGRFLKSWGGPKGSEDGQFNLPHSIAVDAADTIYVVDRENRRVQIFDTEGRFLAKWTHVGNPWGIAISKDGYAYLAEHADEKIVKVALTDGRIVTTFGTRGRGPGQFDWAHGIAVDSKGSVYVADVYGQRVQKFVRAKPDTQPAIR